MMAVRAEQHHPLATEDGLLFAKLLSDEDRFDRIVARHCLEDRVGKDEVGRLLNTLRLKHLDERDADVLQLPIAKAAEVDDVLIALDPLPETLLTFLNRGRTVTGRRIKDATTLTNVLKRLGGC